MTRLTPREKAYKVFLRLAADGYRDKVSMDTIHTTITRELDIIQSWRRVELLKAFEAWGFIETTEKMGVLLIYPRKAGVDIDRMDKILAEEKEDAEAES